MKAPYRDIICLQLNGCLNTRRSRLCPASSQWHRSKCSGSAGVKCGAPNTAMQHSRSREETRRDISPTFKLILILNTLSSLESDKDNFKELGYSITLLKTATDRDWSALAGEVQDSRALVKQRGLCEGLQLSGGIPHEPREEVQSVVAHHGSRKCDTLKKEWESRSESEVWCGSSVIWSKLKVQKLQPVSLREKQIIILIMCHFKNYCTWCHEKLYWLEQHCAPTPSPSEVEL